MRMPATPGRPAGPGGPGRADGAGDPHLASAAEPTVPLAASPDPARRPPGHDGPVVARADGAPPHGYAARPEDPPDEGARWVEGVGYVGPAGAGDRTREPGDDI
jgi:hypothetical protein